MKKETKKILEKREKRKLRKEFKEKLEKWKQDVIERDCVTCQKCGKRLGILNERKHPHHIISLQAVKRKYPQLLSDINNGILLCAYCHKWASDSPHQGSFEFIYWFMKNKYLQYEYLTKFLENI